MNSELKAAIKKPKISEEEVLVVVFVANVEDATAVVGLVIFVDVIVDVVWDGVSAQ